MNTIPDDSTLATLRELLVSEHDLNPESLHNGVTLESLGIDSLATIELLWMVEEQFGITLPTEPAHALETLGDIVQFINTLVEEQRGDAPVASVLALNARGA